MVRTIILFLSFTLLAAGSQLRLTEADNNVLYKLPRPSEPPLVFPCYSSATTGLVMTRLARYYEFMRGSSVMIDAEEIGNTMNASASTILFESMRLGEADFAFSSLVPTMEQKQQAPDLIHFPAAAVGFGVVYNLPALRFPLILDFTSIARILTGNITRWNDAYISKLNPQSHLPDHIIEVVHIEEVAPYILYATKTLRGVDDQFRDMIKESALPDWPLTRYASSISVTGVDGPPAYVAITPYSFALSLLSHAKVYCTSIARMKNAAGVVITPSFESIHNAFSDLATASSFESDSGSIVTEGSESMCNAPGKNSWPFVHQATFSFSYRFSRTTCRAKAELAKFLLCILNSDVIQNALAAQLYTVFSTPTIDERISLRDFLMTKMMCEDLPLNTPSSATTKLGYASLGSTHTNVRGLLVAQYAELNPTAALDFEVMDERMQLQQMLNNQIDMGWIFPITFKYLYANVLEQYLSHGGLAFFPSEIRGVVPTYSLSPIVLALMSSRNALPLLIDMETLAKVFIGQITSWLDPALVALNPALSEAFAAAGGNVSFTIRVIVYGTGDPSANPRASLSNHMMIALNHTQAFRNSGLSWQLPADWTAAIARIRSAGGDAQLAPTEESMETQVEAHPGSIGYKLVTSNVSNPTTDFRIVRYIHKTGHLTTDAIQLDPTPAAFKACADALAANQATPFGALDMESVLDDSSPVAARCWPIPILNTIVIPSDISSQGQQGTDPSAPAQISAIAKDIPSMCFHRKNVVQFLQWLNFDPSVNTPTQMLGRQPFIFSEGFADRFANSLYDLKCGGEFILHLPTETWTLLPQVRDFALVSASLGCSFCVLIGILVCKYHDQALPTNYWNIVLQTISFFGILLLFISMILIAQPATDSMCTGLIWTTSIGLSSLLMPQVLRIINVHSIAKNRSLRFKKTHKHHNIYPSTMSLSLKVCVAALIVMIFDVGLLVVPHLTGRGSPLLSSTTEIAGAHEIYVYHSCAPTAQTAPFAVTLLLLKLALLLFGSIRAFQVRHFTTAFGESTRIAWSLWNASVCFAVIVPLLVLTGSTYGDIFTFLIAFLLVWIGTISLILLFGFQSVRLLDEAWQHFQRTTSSYLSSRHSSYQSYPYGSGTYSSRITTSGLVKSTSDRSSALVSDSTIEFPSLEHLKLSRWQLKKYIDALERQLYAARTSIFNRDSRPSSTNSPGTPNSLRSGFLTSPGQQLQSSSPRESSLASLLTVSKPRAQRPTIGVNSAPSGLTWQTAESKRGGRNRLTANPAPPANHRAQLASGNVDNLEQVSLPSIPSRPPTSPINHKSKLKRQASFPTPRKRSSDNRHEEDHQTANVLESHRSGSMSQLQLQPIYETSSSQVPLVRVRESVVSHGSQ